MIKITPLFTLASISLISACGGASTGGANSFDQEGPISISELNSVGQISFDLEEDIENGSVTRLNQTDLQAVGRATYDGYLLAGIDETEDGFAGRADISANFANGGSVTGTVTEIKIFPGAFTEVEVTNDEDIVYEPIPDDAENYDVAGQLTLSGGAVSTVDGFGSAAIDVTGDLTVPAVASVTDQAETYSVAGTIEGGVLSDGTFVAGGETVASGDPDDFFLDTVIIAR